jgi:phage-related protein
MGFIADGIKKVGEAIGSVVDGIGKAVSGIAKTVSNIAGAVGDFINNSPIGKFLSVIPGVGPLVSMVGKGAELVKGVSDTVADVTDFASRFAQNLISSGTGAAAALSSTGLGFMGAAVQNFGSIDNLVGFAEGLSPAFQQQEGLSDLQQQIQQFAPWNVAQLLAAKHAELLGVGK